MQLDPINHILQAPGSYRLRLKCDQQLSSFALNFNLRRFILAAQPADQPMTPIGDMGKHEFQNSDDSSPNSDDESDLDELEDLEGLGEFAKLGDWDRKELGDLGWAVQADRIKTRVESKVPTVSAQQYDETFSSFAFSLNLRRYTWEENWCPSTRTTITRRPTRLPTRQSSGTSRSWCSGS